jgi:prepilin-type processing-associated H-X9-DG protein/prepilin-type N-terminal cleavage/methylation domain-containing protein
MCTCSPSCRPRRPSHARRAFTLVELLSAVGVISVLIAMLLPTLSSARAQAQRTACLSNLRQLAVAFTMYLNDNAGRFPRPAQHLVPKPEDWIYHQPDRERECGTIARYVNRPFDPRLYRCPSDDVTSHPSLPSILLGAPPTRYDYSYTVNEYICRLWPNPTLRINQVRNPSEKILLIDESASTIDDGCWAWQPSQGAGKNVLSNRHDRKAEDPKRANAGRGNVAFADGHAAFLARADSYQRRHYDPTLR